METEEESKMSNTIRNPNTHHDCVNKNGMPNIVSKRDRYVEMGIIAGTRTRKDAEAWRDY